MPYNERIIHFFGLKRSGQHALIEWIVQHFDSLVGLTNNVQTIPLTTFKMSHYFNVNGSVHIKRMRAEEHHKAKFDKEALFITYEDPHRKRNSLEDCMHHIKEVDQTELTGTYNRVQYVACIRDFYNNMASRLSITRSRRPTSHTPHGLREGVQDWWKRWAKESKGWHRRYELGSDIVWINFNLWMQSMFYRRYLESILGLDHKFADRADLHSANNLAHKDYGGHRSQFDGWEHTGQQCERYLRYLEDPEYCEKVLADDEARELNLAMFGWTLSREGTRYSTADTTQATS